MVEVLASVLASPKFLYLVRAGAEEAKPEQRVTDSELATRLSFFSGAARPIPS